MKLFLFSFATIVVLQPSLWIAAYKLVRDYSGQDFFQGWDFYGSWDNLTLGDVWWLDEADATNQHLAYINSANNAIIKVDNTSDVAFNQKRNTVRITTQDTYALGSLWIIDLLHLPYGCSVWPAFWTKGPLWPNDGEIDIIEGINVMPNNQAALHTTPGCMHPVAVNELGIAGELDCSTAAGCTVTESSPNSFESGFALMGGGVWACQFDVAGIFIWFWSRPNIPASITSANSTSTVDISQWGTPSASYPASSCNISQFFTAQNLVVDITLCGNWAGIGPVYNATCGTSGSTGLCYEDNVIGPGSPKYDNAYFEISYIRAYTTPVPSISAAAALATPSGLVTGTSTISESGGMGGPTAVVTVTASASATSTVVSSSVNGVGAVVRGSWSTFLCMVGSGVLVGLGMMW